MSHKEATEDHLHSKKSPLSIKTPLCCSVKHASVWQRFLRGNRSFCKSKAEYCLCVCRCSKDPPQLFHAPCHALSYMYDASGFSFVLWVCNVLEWDVVESRLFDLSHQACLQIHHTCLRACVCVCDHVTRRLARLLKRCSVNSNSSPFKPAFSNSQELLSAAHRKLS